MELDNLKNTWNKAGSRPLNINIMETITSMPKNPLAQLQRKLKFNFYIFPVVVILFAGHLFSSTSPLHASTCMLYGVLLTEFIFYAYSYGMVKRLQQAEGPTRVNLLQRVSGLQQVMKWQLVTNEVLYIVMAVFLEISMRNHWDNRFEDWYNIALPLRIFAYAAILVFIYLMKRRSNHRHYGHYIDKLSDLLKQTE